MLSYMGCIVASVVLGGMNGHILGEDGGSGQMAQGGKWHRNADEAV